ncbi:CpaF family protein, partial [bacterium M00.F.Ca.ET.152.01.1.1]
MFGKRGTDDGNRVTPEFRPPAAPAAPAPTGTMTAERPPAPAPSAPAAPPTRRPVEAPPMAPEPPRRVQRERSETYYDTK